MAEAWGGERTRACIDAAETRQELREDAIVIVPANGPPIRCGRAIFFRRPEMVAQIANNRFATLMNPAAG